MADIPIKSDSQLPAPLSTQAKQEKRAKQLAEAHLTLKARRVHNPAMQGMFSRTRVVEMANKDKFVVQFRLGTIDVTYASHARTKFGSVVPSLEQIDSDAELKELGVYVYIMPYVPGTLWRRMNKNSIEQCTAAAASLGKILSQGFVEGPSAPVIDEYILPHLRRSLDSLTGPSEVLVPHVKQAIKSADSLKSFPLWVSHYDLNDMNMLVDSESYAVSGIIDWELSRDLSFGVGLHRVFDTVVGRNVQGNIAVTDAGLEAEKAFWSSLLDNLPESVRRMVNANLEALQQALYIGTLIFHCLPPNPPTERVTKFLNIVLTYRLPQIRGQEEPFQRTDAQT